MRAIALAILLSLTPARALGFGVAPAETVLIASPGVRIPAGITVFSPDPLPLRARLVDWRIHPDGEVELLPPASLPRSLAPYLELRERRLVPRPEARLNLTLRLPPGAEGSYHAALLLVPDLPPGPAGPGLALDVQAAILHPIYARVPGTARPELRLAEARIAGDGLRALLENRGNVYLKVRAWLTALAPDGAIVREALVLEDVLFPGASRQLEAELPPEAGAVRLVVEAPGAGRLLWEAGR